MGNRMPKGEEMKKTNCLICEREFKTRALITIKGLLACRACHRSISPIKTKKAGNKSKEGCND